MEATIRSNNGGNNDGTNRTYQHRCSSDLPWPEDRYRGYFRQDHGLRIYGLPFLIVGGYPRFQYKDYWLSAVNPWPEYWGMTVRQRRRLRHRRG
jgi:hypothetical protein